MLSEILAFLTKGDSQQAYELFKKLDKQDERIFFSLLAETIARAKSLSIAPKIIALLQRKLKPGKNYKDFFAAWAPPISPADTESHTFDYCNVTTQVINVESAIESGNILSIGLLDAYLPDLLQDWKEHYSDSDARRAEKIDTIAEESSGPAKMYAIRGICTLGRAK